MKTCQHKNKAYSSMGTTNISYWICKDCGFEGQDEQRSPDYDKEYREIKKMMEIRLEQNENERYKMIKKSINILVDFAERWNKQDKEREVANACNFLDSIINPISK